MVHLGASSFQYLLLVLSFIPCVHPFLFSLPSFQCPVKVCSVTKDSALYTFTCENANCSEIPLELDTLNIMDMRGNLIKSIPPLPYSALRQLDLSNNNISVIDPNAFLQLGELETLNLGENKLTSLSSRDFEGLAMLRNLFVNGNLITRLDPGSFFSLELQKLDVSYNQISRIERDTFSSMFDLTNLYLKGNRLTEIQQLTFIGLHDIQRIDLQENYIDTIHPGAFGNCHKLRYLTLSYNNISRLYNDSFAGLEALISLDMHSNSLAAFEKGSFLSLTALEDLYLDRNPLVALEGDLLPKSLSRISITYMPLLRSIGHWVFRDMTNLVRLDLSKNSQLTTIHDAAFTYNGSGVFLSELDLSDNKLSTLYHYLVEWRKLTFLDLSGNPWDCNCRIEWMKEVYMTSDNRQHTICATPKQFAGKSIAEMDFKDFECDKYGRYRRSVSICIIVFLTFVVGVGVVLVACKTRKRKGYEYKSWCSFWNKKQKGYDVMYNTVEEEDITAAITILNDANEKRYLRDHPAPTAV